jgi:capsular exopolysaccharide synthesis family protein
MDNRIMAEIRFPDMPDPIATIDAMPADTVIRDDEQSRIEVPKSMWRRWRSLGADAQDRARTYRRHGTPLIRAPHASVVEKLVVNPEAPPSLVEQYRKLAATLYYAQAERGVKVLMVTSAIPGDGKSLTAANLALTLSESYRRRVLLIDADLRRPSLHLIFQIPNISGLGQELKPDAEGTLCPIPLTTNLSLVPVGERSSDPMSGLTSSRMRDLVRDASEPYDWVVIDTPPVGLLSDAKLLVSMVDGALFVIGAGETQYTLIQGALDALGREKVLGVVLNRADDRRAAGRYGYYRYYDAYTRARTSG